MASSNEIESQILGCSKCPILVKNRTRVVPGVGSAQARMMFVGEAPGFNEDKQGEPFVGAAGSFLNELLASIGLKRSQIFITNVIKCRPPDNREPMPSEIQNCRVWLDAQIAHIRPQVIVTLGRFAMDAFLPGKSISKIHGQAFKDGQITYFAMYHPAAALYQQSQRDVIKNDMLKIPAILAQAAAQKIEPPDGGPRQMNLF